MCVSSCKCVCVFEKFMWYQRWSDIIFRGVRDSGNNSAVALLSHVQTLPKWENSIKTNKWENGLHHWPDIPNCLIGMMTGLLGSSLKAIFTAAHIYFFWRFVLCMIPAYLHPQNYAFPAVLTCIFRDLSLWCRSELTKGLIFKSDSSSWTRIHSDVVDLFWGNIWWKH